MVAEGGDPRDSLPRCEEWGIATDNWDRGRRAGVRRRRRGVFGGTRSRKCRDRSHRQGGQRRHQLSPPGFGGRVCAGRPRHQGGPGRQAARGGDRGAQSGRARRPARQARLPDPSGRVRSRVDQEPAGDGLLQGRIQLLRGRRRAPEDDLPAGCQPDHPAANPADARDRDSRRGGRGRRLRPAPPELGGDLGFQTPRKAASAHRRRAGGSADDVADPLGRAPCWIKGAGPLGQLAELAPELLEFQDALIEVAHGRRLYQGSHSLHGLLEAGALQDGQRGRPPS